jgi:3-oxoacyl-[acyl-carrier-protein] synthase-3
MREGIATGAATFEKFLAESGWSRADLNKTICHQVGSGHRKLMLESLGLPSERDFTTLEWLGNTGSAALPITMAVGLEQGFVTPSDRLAMLGIGSGINCLMLAVEWQKTLVRGSVFGGASLQLASDPKREDEASYKLAPHLLRPHCPPNQIGVEVIDGHSGIDHD